MQDEEQQQPGEQTPDQETPAEEKSPEEQQADEQHAPEEQSPAEGSTPEEGEAEPEAPPAEEALAEDAAPEDDTPAEEAAAPQAEAVQGGDRKQKKEEVVPGAELDPIAIEPERELDAEERARREAEEEERLRRERELIGDTDETPLAAKPTKLSADASYAATGKRKSSVARVILRQGNGSIQVNKRTLEEYFPRSYLQTVAKQPLAQSGYEGNVDVRIRVHGGGISGQAAAVRHGIARALCDVDPALRPELKRRGMLTRDARVKERRKAGLKKARKKPQFSKR
jgi:small subunit ribosomal protein S9